jgi:hypothetical protein
MTVVDMLDLGIKILTPVPLVFAAISLWQSSKYQKRQSNFNAFTHYTKQYEQIMSSFPEDTYMLRFEIDQRTPQMQGLRLSALRYLNMTSEEYYLLKNGYLDRKVWNIWLPEIKRTLKTPLFVLQWQSLRHEFRSYPDFSKFVEQIQLETNVISTRRS